MEKRVGRLKTLWQASPEAIEQASYSIAWALKFPGMADPSERAAGIRETHDLDDAGISQAVVVALVRCGILAVGRACWPSWASSSSSPLRQRARRRRSGTTT
jgi:hypothetical protein